MKDTQKKENYTVDKYEIINTGDGAYVLVVGNERYVAESLADLASHMMFHIYNLGVNP